MFVQIPGFRKKADTPPPSSSSLRFSADTGLLLFILRPSKILWRAQLAVHLCMALCFSFALIPQFVNRPWLILVWITANTLLLVSAYCCWKATTRAPQHLSFSKQGWRLRDGEQEQYLDWTDEAVVWSWLIVLRFRERSSRRRINFVFLPDSAPAEDLRRLRVWLRTLLWRSQT